MTNLTLPADGMPAKSPFGGLSRGAFSPLGRRRQAPVWSKSRNLRESAAPAACTRGASARLSTAPAARIAGVDLARIAWLVTVLVCAVTVLILLIQGYYGYAGVTLAVAVSAGINLL